MNGATTIQERLKDLRLNKGLKLEELAEQTGISKSALGSYEKDDYKEINHGNLILLADFYGVSLDYLFCRTENRAEINTPLRELHLSDEMVALLKSGRINNRLLCELATHKDFIKFLADIEIYVDGIATMQIATLHFETGLYTLNLPAGEILKEEKINRVFINFDLQSNTLFTPGIDDADENIIPNDEVVIINNDEVVGVGKSTMSGKELVESTKGVGVKIRHQIK